MGIHRRRLLQYTGAAWVVSALPASLARAASVLRVAAVHDGAALPRFAPGTLLLADTSCTRFSGAGLYLYPAWGQPRPYHVSARGGLLEFRNPGSGVLLWTQSAGLDAEFAGQVLDLPEAAALVADCPALNVPALPA